MHTRIYVLYIPPKAPDAPPPTPKRGLSGRAPAGGGTGEAGETREPEPTRDFDFLIFDCFLGYLARYIENIGRSIYSTEAEYSTLHTIHTWVS